MDDVHLALAAVRPGLPVIGVGHSIGGAAMVKAELARPGSFARLVLCEPVLFERDVAFDAPSALAERTSRRRNRWQSLAEARAFLASRPMYQHLHREAFDAYLEAGLVAPDPGTPQGEWCLACRPDVEAAMYRSVGRSVYAELAQLACPVTIVVGERSDFMSAGPGHPTTDAFFRALAKRFPESTVQVMAGVGHMAPLEDPAAFAEIVSAAIHQHLDGNDRHHHQAPRSLL